MESLHNKYFFVRHGRSLANEKELIVSAPTQGITGYGLTEEGKKEVERSASKAKQDGIFEGSVVIVSSDFARAKETAEIIARTLGVKDILFTPLLRERSFGQWDM